MQEYWKSSLEELFSDYNLELTPQLFEDIMQIRDMESEACGYSCISNPKDSEVNELKRKIIEIEESHRVQIKGVIDGVANRRNVDPSDVYIDARGNVTYVSGL